MGKDIEVGRQGYAEKYFDYALRAQWLRGVVLGGNEGLVYSTMHIIGASQDKHENYEASIFRGFIGLIAGALTMAVAEFVSVYAQIDVVKSQNERDLRVGKVGALKRMPPPNPTQIAIAASFAYVFCGLLPLTLTWGVKDKADVNLVLYILGILATFSMVLTGSMVTILGKAPLLRSLLRVQLGGWLEIGIMFGKIKLLQS